MRPPPPRSTLFPYTTLFRSSQQFCGRKLISARIWLRQSSSFSKAPSATPLTSQCTFQPPSCSIETSSPVTALITGRSEEHTSELQSLTNLVCRLLLEKKKKN